MLTQIERIIEGKSFFDTQKMNFILSMGTLNLNSIWLQKEFGKIALIWQLAKNGTLEKGSILFWDEPKQT